jgi:hypothetical protein
MSLKVMSALYEHSCSVEGCAACSQLGRSVLLAIIWHSGKHDADCWPSIDLLAQETRVSDRSVQGALRALKVQGWIFMIEKGTGRGKPSTYRVNKGRFAKGEAPSPIPTEKGEPPAPFPTVKGEADSPITKRKGEPPAPFSEPERVKSTTVKGEICALKGEICAEPPDPLKGVTERNRKERALHTASPEIDASMAVSGLILTIGLHSRDARIVLDDMAREVEKRGEDLTSWADTLAKSWQLLEKSRPRLEYHWGAAKFFGEGHYKNSDGWPWKQDQRPKKKLRAVNE